jgi:tRNA (adenine57-N1/adenine58-N1)-methyltransferase
MTLRDASRLKEGDLVLLLSPAKGETYLVRLQPGAVQGSHLGKIPHDTILDSGYGETIYTHLGRPFLVLKPSLGEYTRRLKRNTQIIYPKEAGYFCCTWTCFPEQRWWSAAAVREFHHHPRHLCGTFGAGREL